VALLVGPPPPELARELEQVRSRARGLSDYLRTTNAPFPEDFPRADILSISTELAELPDGTAQGCQPPLEYADMRLADIRSLHFPAISPPHVPEGDHAPALAREEGLDRDLSGLMVAVATARRVANRIAAIEPEESPPEPSVPREIVSGLEGAESKGARLEEDLTAAREDFDKAARVGSDRADQFRRTLTDAKVVAGLSRVELAQENITPAWLKRFGGWLSDYPIRLEDAGRALEVSVDVVETVHGGWRKYSRRLTDALYSSIREFAADLQGLGRRLGETRQNTVPVESFVISKVRSKILAGQAPPVEWAPFVDELDMSATPLKDLSPVHTLTALRILHLSRTAVSDLSPLRGLTGLEALTLASTNVSDLSALRTATNLEHLVLTSTKVRDLSPLQGLTALRDLYAAFTQVTDLSVVQFLTALETLDLTETQITDVSPLSSLAALQTLSLCHTNVADFSPLSSLTALRRLNLSYTKMSDVSLLKNLTVLENLDLSHTQVSDLSPLNHLSALENLRLNSTPVADLSPLRSLKALHSLSAYSTRVDDLSPLKSLISLQSLDLAITQVSDLSPLLGLTALTHLDVRMTRVSDLSPLIGLKSLRTLNIRGTMVTDASMLAHRKDLQIQS
jgi:Leucine-rich repeat (LRR) protein